MYSYEILDILFLVKSLKRPDPSLPIRDFISFSSSSTRAGCTSKLVHQESSTSASSHSYFRRVTRLWNALPIIDLNCSLPTIKLRLKKYMWNRFIENFDPNAPCTFISYAPAPNAPGFITLLIFLPSGNDCISVSLFISSGRQ